MTERGGSGLNFGIITENSTLDDWERLSLCKLVQSEALNLSFHAVSKEKKGQDTKDSPAYTNRITNKLWEKYREKVRSIDTQRTSAQKIINQTAKLSLQELCKKKNIKQRQGITKDEIDFIIQYSQGKLPRNVFRIPKHGIWSFFFNGVKSGFPIAYFWNIYDSAYEMQVSLETMSENQDSENKLLYEGTYRTIPGSPNDLVDFLQDIANWPLRVARRILDGDECFIQKDATISGSSSAESPELYQLLSFFLKHGIYFANQIVRGVHFWNIGVTEEPIQDFVSPTTSPQIEWFGHTNRHRFIADPFPVEIDGQMYIFVENFPYSEFQGKISYMTYPDGFRNGDLRTAHEEPFHLSYPYIFKKGANTYVTPETYEANEIRLYRMKSPDEWEFETVLIPNVEGLDPTLMQYEDRWWLFFTKNPYSNTTLYLWYSSELTGDWKPHAENPVKTDIRSARPAGSLFLYQGDLYRPSQKCSREYGEKITFNRIEQMTPEEYVERSVSEYPAHHNNRYPNGRHTIAESQGLTVIDGKRYIKNRYFITKRMNQVASKLR